MSNVKVHICAQICLRISCVIGHKMSDARLRTKTLGEHVPKTPQAEVRSTHTQEKIEIEALGSHSRRWEFYQPRFPDDMEPYAESTSCYKVKAKHAGEPDNIPRIKACVTMWHETKHEMLKIMKSIYRMDEDQWACLKEVKHFNLSRQEIGYYEYETHIFFDDAFTPEDERNPDSTRVINDHVRDLVHAVEDAGLQMYQSLIKLHRPRVTPTPYGGRLEWKLPGGTTLTAHLKDKTKIRQKKRWSQCMYMHYLLSYGLMEKTLPQVRKEKIAKNTFLLALDGDVDFQPRAVEHLVDLMNRYELLGAACGRIQPTGHGPIVWYQKFEYAIGHWLQKATESMLGCVLCSPGCFSLFRARALITAEVMGKYTTVSTEPLHYVQYDQGEDRWLCTLLLQQGSCIQYSAISDSKTHAPEEFREFFSQRLRWLPSTMANIIDLLRDSRRTVQRNSGISWGYMFYHLVLLFVTVIGPGSILLLLTGACITLFELGEWLSFALNLTPILGFGAVCYFCKDAMQIKVAQVLSALYALLMVGVLVAITVQISKGGILAPSSLFFLVITGSFIFAALLHPVELGCLTYGLVYYIAIPSTHILLIIYALFNAHNVSWGTREEEKRGSFSRETEGSGPTEMEAGPIPSWAQDPCFISRRNQDQGQGSPEVGALDDDEIKFWEHLIEKHLSPLYPDRKKEAKAAEALLALRDRAVAYFFVSNGIFVSLIFFLTLHKDHVSIRWPLDKDSNLEPIGLVFAILFGVILLWQFLAMLGHRLRTLSHILTSTSLSLGKDWIKLIKSVRRMRKKADDGSFDTLDDFFQENVTTLEESSKIT